MASKDGKKTGGRVPGVTNKVSGTAKENMICVFTRLGGTAAMANWAREHPSDFYRLYAKLLPHELTGPMGNPIQIVFNELQAKGL